MKYKLTLAYKGTKYCGWQRQTNDLSIQEVIEDKLSILLRTPTAITGAGRTDAGVHAMCQVAHFSTETELDLFRFTHSMNGMLPLDIRLRSAEAVSENFHARYSATGKIYHYHLNLSPVQNPFLRETSWHIPQKLDLNHMAECIKVLIGTHDFTSFANDPTNGAVARNPIRTLKRIDIVPEADGIRLEFESESFMYKMVRNLTGTLVEAAKGKYTVEDIVRILEQKDRRAAGTVAPPQGLFLMEVYYESFL